MNLASKKPNEKNKMIEKLTKKQEDLLPVYANKWIQNGLSDEFPSDERVHEIVDMFYKKGGVETPPVHIVDSPSKAIALAKKMGAKKEDISFAWMHHDAGSIGFYEFFRKETKVKDIEAADMFVAAAELGWTLFFDKACIVCKKPTVYLETPHENVIAGTVSVLHRLDGPAVDFGPGDESNVYAVGGVVVEAYVVDHPEKITVSDIEEESNAEVRRVKIDQYGQSRYLQDSGAEVVNEDDFGVLYRKSLGSDEPLMMVKVVNSTEEPDGTFKDYFIRVDPNAYDGLKTARQAVASTWRNEDGSLMFANADDYCDQLVAQS
jgi:hypothetical protein